MTEQQEKCREVYVLRVRLDDSQPWSEPAYYATRKERDKEAAMNRIISGIRTHSYEEKRLRREIVPRPLD